MILESVITCPECGTAKSETMPTDACQFFYECTGCGIKRLFDEDAFRGYGPYSYDLERLLAHDQAKRMKNKSQEPSTEHRSAS